MLIFNGRLGQDRGIEEYTRDDTTGRSVVDYVMGTPLLFLMSNGFRVLPKFPESDHKAIAFQTNCRSITRNLEVKEENNWKSMYKYTFTPGHRKELLMHCMMIYLNLTVLNHYLQYLNCVKLKRLQKFLLYMSSRKFYGNVTTLHVGIC